MKSNFKKITSVWQRVVLLTLVLVLPLSAVLVALLRTDNNVVGKVAPPIASQKNYWRESKATNLRLDDLDIVLEQLGESAGLGRDVQDELLFDLVVDEVGSVNQDMLSYVVESTIGDFINYQAEIFDEIDRDMQKSIREGVVGDSYAIYFYDNILVGNAESFVARQLELASRGNASSRNTNALYAALIAAGMAGWAASVVTGAMSTVGWTASQGWWIPNFVKAAAIGVALLVIVAVIVTYWNQIASIFQSIINYFVDVAQKFASQIKSFFDNLRGQAQEANKTINDVIGNASDILNHIKKVVLSTTTIGQFKDGFYPGYVSNNNLYIIGLPFRDENLALATFKVLGYYGGIYTFKYGNAERVARNAGGGREPILASMRENIQKGNFDHYHAYNETPQGHAWFGTPMV